MRALESVRELYEQYIARVEQLERDKKPGDGLFGFGSAPKDDPCHERFAQELAELLGRIDAEEPGSDQVRELLEYIYRAPRTYPEPLSAYWTLEAVQGLTAPLAARLTPADARALRDEYGKMYKRWERMPSHKKALAALEKAAKE